MNKNLRAFMSAVENDETLSARFEEICALQDMNEVHERTLQLARELSIDLDETDLAPVSSLDEDDLETVAGGFWVAQPRKKYRFI